MIVKHFVSVQNTELRDPKYLDLIRIGISVGQLFDILHE